MKKQIKKNPYATLKQDVIKAPNDTAKNPPRIKVTKSKTDLRVKEGK